MFAPVRNGVRFTAAVLDFEADHLGQVGDAGDAHGARVELRRKRGARERGVSAVAPADDTNALGISDALVDERANAVGDVVLHAQAPLVSARIGVRLTEAG